tara:strand:- start:2816 stop:3511 length:696 start_codon:yes stop_codon:yes gene_type:complete
MQLFFTENTKKEFILSSEESKHITKVLRKNVGDKINFTDGKGNLLICEIIISDTRGTQVKIIKKISKKKQHNYHLHVAIAPTKNMDRFKWFLEKSCEIGIDEITPIICDRSERKIIKKERCNRILISAMKQSLKYHLPKLNDTIYFSDFISKKHKEDKFIAYCGEGIKSELKKEQIEGKNLILIGPEGDFTPKEIEKSEINNFTPISLGTSRLRTETAGIVAVHTVNIKVK